MKKLATITECIEEYVKYIQQGGMPFIFVNGIMLESHSIEKDLNRNSIIFFKNNNIIATVNMANIQSIWFDDNDEIIEYTMED